MRFTYRHFPLITIGHDKATMAAEAAEAAGAQGMFWEMHDLLFQRQSEWAQISADQLPAVLSTYAQELGLDVDQFDQAIQDQTYQMKVMESYNTAASMGLGGTPSFIVNGRFYPSDQWGLSYEGLEAFIGMTLLEPRMYTSPPPQVVDEGTQYQATIRTAKGDIVIELYPDEAPANVNSFVFLAQEGWYDGNTFFRVIADFVAQAGDPTNTGVGSPGYRCTDEITSRTYGQEGVVGIANAGPGTNTGGSQFFITLSPQPILNGGYTIIGQVVEGMDVVKSITIRDPSNPTGPGDVIETIVIEEQ
jgi:peptidylprolyl isomerase/peptidyl-prolyl cis-trans isomerase B (cyclophilin B)